MATDKSEPKTGLIIQVGIGAIVCLVVIRMGMVSYFENVQADIRAQQGLESQKPEMSTVNAASSALAQSPTPIDKAMQMLANASPNRQGMAGVEPQTSHDMRAVTDCWQAMGCDGGGLAVAAAPDAGAATAQAADASTPADAATDAAMKGAPAPRPNPPRQNPPH
jgi:hypothetical protein